MEENLCYLLQRLEKTEVSIWFLWLYFLSSRKPNELNNDFVFFLYPELKYIEFYPLIYFICMSIIQLMQTHKQPGEDFTSGMLCHAVNQPSGVIFCAPLQLRRRMRGPGSAPRCAAAPLNWSNTVISACWENDTSAQLLMYCRALIYSSDYKHPALTLTQTHTQCYVGCRHTSAACWDCTFLCTQRTLQAGRGAEQTIPTMSVYLVRKIQRRATVWRRERWVETSFQTYRLISSSN